MSKSFDEIFGTSIAIIIFVSVIATISGTWGIIPDTWIEPIITFTTEWLFSPNRILTKIVYVFLGISGLSAIGVIVTIFIKNILGD